MESIKSQLKPSQFQTNSQTPKRGSSTAEMGECASPLRAFLLFLLQIDCLFRCSDAEIKTGKITADSGEAMAFVGRFAFDPPARVAISVFDVTVIPSMSSPPSHLPDYSTIGFFLVSEDHLSTLRPFRFSTYMFHVTTQERNATEAATILSSRSFFCPPYSTHIRRLFTIRELPPPRYRTYNGIFDVPEAGQYLLFLSSCAEGWRASMGIRAEMYNLRVDGSRDYLTADLSLFPVVYTGFAGAYAAFLGVWLYVCLWRGEPHHHQRHHHRQLPSLSTTADHRVHSLVASLLLAKALNLVLAAEDLRNVAAIGTPHSWDVPFFLLRLSKNAVLLTVAFLAWYAWPSLRSCLQHREKRILSVVLPLQLLANAAFVAATTGNEVTPSVGANPDWRGLAVLVVDGVCGFAVLYAVARSLRGLKGASCNCKGETARSIARLAQFRRIYVVAVAQLYLVRILVLSIGCLASYEKRWVDAAAAEATCLGFFAYVSHSLRPVEKYVYIHLAE